MKYAAHLKVICEPNPSHAYSWVGPTDFSNDPIRFVSYIAGTLLGWEEGPLWMLQNVTHHLVQTGHHCKQRPAGLWGAEDAHWCL